MYIVYILVSIIIVKIKAQTGGTTASGQIYVCVPPGFCNNGSGGGGGGSQGIDPRIVTPGQLCPSGAIPCYTQGPGSICGQRFVQQTNTGDGTANAGAYPWQAYLQSTTNSFAGSGVLIDNYHVLTAAHKVQNYVNNPSSVTVIMGVYNPAQMTNTQSRTVAMIALHPNYNVCPNLRNNCSLKNDIAILRLSSPISLSQNNINTACLPTASTSNTYLNQRCVVSGWGQTSFTTNDAPTQPMKQVYVTITDYNTCRASYSNATLLGNNVDFYLDSMGEICAGGQNMRDACLQDGGSPLVCLDSTTNRYNIAGLVIWGKNCGLPGVYGVYVSVPYYRNWIDTAIESFNAAAGKR